MLEKHGEASSLAPAAGNDGAFRPSPPEAKEKGGGKRGRAVVRGLLLPPAARGNPARKGKALFFARSVSTLPISFEPGLPPPKEGDGGLGWAETERRKSGVGSGRRLSPACLSRRSLRSGEDGACRL